MKLNFLRLDAVIKPPPIFDGVAEIQIVYTLQGIKPDNMTFESHEDTTSDHSSR
jgi:hypothetical protein